MEDFQEYDAQMNTSQLRCGDEKSRVAGRYLLERPPDSQATDALHIPIAAQFQYGDALD
jgi:hypothetical protein